MIPAVEGVLTSEDVRATARSIASMQEPCGSIPWTIGEHTDIWNHVEAAMALLVGGEREAAEKAYRWALTMQRHDGSFPTKIVAGEVEDPSGETNMSAYLAVGVWHHWLICRDIDFVRECWPAVRGALDFVVRLQLPFGGINWSQYWTDGEPGEWRNEALLTGSSSMYQSLRAGVAIAELMEDPQLEWELAGGRLGHAVRCHQDEFLDKDTFSMDWYYPVLGGALRGDAALERIEADWDRFVVPGLGIRCVDTNTWVTGAETCELVMALSALGDHKRAMRLFTEMQHLRESDGSYWTGWVYGDDVYWPHEHTTYTAAAVILAADDLSWTTPGAGIMRGDTLAPHFAEIALECGCDSADRIASRA